MNFLISTCHLPVTQNILDQKQLYSTQFKLNLTITQNYINGLFRSHLKLVTNSLVVYHYSDAKPSLLKCTIELRLYDTLLRFSNQVWEHK